MTHFTADPQETETSSSDAGVRFTELADQHWARSKSLALAESEGIKFNDEHWAVIVFLRKYYLDHGLPITARTTARVATSTCTGYSAVARLRKAAGSPICAPPAYATDLSFGTSY